MNLLSLAQQMAEAADLRIIFDQDACLHSLDKYSECDSCFEICPAKAIQPGSPPLLSEEFCQTCQACLPICPASAYSFSGLDTVNAIRNSINRQKLKICDLCCGINPKAEHGPAESAAGVRVRGCLAGIGLGGYLSLLSQGLDRLYVRIDACGDCPLSMLHDQIGEQVGHAQKLLEPWGREGSLVMIGNLDGGDAVSRPFWNAESPPRSRREILQSKPSAVAGEMVESNNFRDRIRVIRAVADLRAKQSMVEGKASLEGMGFAIISISDECTACGTCGRACPTDALNYESANSRFSLTFSPESCIGCEICDHVCAPQAVTIDHAPAVRQVFGNATSQLLQEGQLARCRKCKAPFAAHTGTELCPVCEFRRNNPFGSVLPPVRPLDRIRLQR